MLRHPLVIFLTATAGAVHAQDVLPRPAEPFSGKIGLTYKDSQAVKPKLKVPSTFGLDDAPNILLVLIDDCGYGQMSTFGGRHSHPGDGPSSRPSGLRYTHFHTTAICSPTRAALLAGRNHHTVGTGTIIECGTGYLGDTGIIPKSTALVSQILRDNGYATSMFGKWHNTPEPFISPAGPFDRWPRIHFHTGGERRRLDSPVA